MSLPTKTLVKRKLKRRSTREKKGGDGGALHHEEHEHEHHAGAPDPHVWLDPTRAKTMVEAIEADLSRSIPHMRMGTTRAKEFRSSLDTVDQTTKDATANGREKGLSRFMRNFRLFRGTLLGLRSSP